MSPSLGHQSVLIPTPLTVLFGYIVNHDAAVQRVEDVALLVELRERHEVPEILANQTMRPLPMSRPMLIAHRETCRCALS